ncbi:MAG: cytochrome C [Mariprofundaceae bacterium]|nr:cytochrome C [Mariprofundaceae bacterium]
MKKVMMMTVAAAFVLGMHVAVSTDADAAAWKKCATCHNFTAKNKVGPALGDVLGRKAGAAPGFKYKYTKYGTDWVWDEAHLREWMCDSKKAVKKFTGNDKAKTKMPPQKVCDPAAQDEVLAKLKG